MKEFNGIKCYHVNGDIRVRKSSPTMRYNAIVLHNQLCTIELKIINPDDGQEIICKALIDTGSEYSFICESVFNQFKTDKEKIINNGSSISLFGGIESKIWGYPFRFKLPANNWAVDYMVFGVSDLGYREEYNALIGMNLLKKSYRFIYNGESGQAWLEY